MLAFRSCSRGFLRLPCIRSCHHGPPPYDTTQEVIGDREIVGHGISGQPVYVDMHGFPFPAIRFKECTPEIMALREKERGDWGKLTIDEKKCLYRASFRQTFAELDAPSTEWKSIVGTLLMTFALSMALFYWEQAYVQVEWPDTFQIERRIEQYYRAVAINNQPFTGNVRPPGAELRVHPKNREMLEKLQKTQ